MYTRGSGLLPGRWWSVGSNLVLDQMQAPLPEIMGGSFYSVTHLPVFRRNELTPSSWPKCKLSKQVKQTSKQNLVRVLYFHLKTESQCILQGRG
jgi:hypothetical protein